MPQPRWVSAVLFLAAAYCLAWGAFILLFPEISFRVYGFAGDLQNPLLWSGSGFTICLYGVGYGISGTDSVRHVAVVLLGLLAKIFGTVGIVGGWATGVFHDRVLIWVFVNDVIWWLPLGLIVYRACKSGIVR